MRHITFLVVCFFPLSFSNYDNYQISVFKVLEIRTKSIVFRNRIFLFLETEKEYFTNLTHGSPKQSTKPPGYTGRINVFE